MYCGILRTNSSSVTSMLTKINKSPPRPLCACGCKKKVSGWVKWGKDKGWKKYINHHANKNRKFTEEHKKKIGDGNRGIKRTPAQIQVNAKVHTGLHPSKKTRQKMSKALKGHLVSDLTKRRIVTTRKRNGSYKVSEKTRRKISLSIKQKWQSIAYRNKLSNANGSNWLGGLDARAYSFSFNCSLRTKIKERDRFTCQNPKCKGLSKLLHVHHIDYNKKNSNPNNLITVCAVCHAESGTNRSRWKRYYQNIIKHLERTR